MSVEHRHNIISGRRGLWSHATLLMLGTYWFSLMAEPISALGF